MYTSQLFSLATSDFNFITFKPYAFHYYQTVKLSFNLIYLSQK